MPTPMRLSPSPVSLREAEALYREAMEKRGRPVPICWVNPEAPKTTKRSRNIIESRPRQRVLGGGCYLTLPPRIP